MTKASLSRKRLKKKLARQRKMPGRLKLFGSKSLPDYVRDQRYIAAKVRKARKEYSEGQAVPFK